MTKYALKFCQWWHRLEFAWLSQSLMLYGHGHIFQANRVLAWLYWG